VSKKIPIVQKAGTAWLFKMAWRDGRASGKKLFLFMASIILGIAAVVAIQSFSDSLKENISSQSRSLMGADYIIDSNHPPNDKVLAIIDSLGGGEGKEINFASMALFPRNGTTKLVRVRGITEGFPFYGELETEPPQAGEQFRARGGALVDATVMLQFGIVPGDSVKIGELTFPITGALKSIPGGSALSSTVAPPVVIPYRFIEQTGLIQQGSRLDYEYYFRADPGTDLEELDKVLDPILDLEGADIDTHLATSRGMGRRYENFGRFLNLVAFIALLLGCVGIASSIHIYMKEKLPAVAVIKCLGASRRQSFLIYLIQIAAMGLVGGIIGTSAGLLLQQVFPILLEEFLPVEIDVSISAGAAVMGVVLGVVMSVLFALLPLMSTLYVSPLQVLRIQEGQSQRNGKASIIVVAAIILLIFLFSLMLLENWRYAIAFVTAIVVTFSALAGVATLFIRVIKKYFPVNWGFCSRQSLLNLFRPRNQTMTMILAIGVGTFLISTLYFTKDILLAKASIQDTSKSPNLILLDVQTDQQEAVASAIRPRGLPVLDNIPIVTMRVHSIKGRTVNELRQDTTSHVGRWVMNHEFRVTYRDSMIESETLTGGEWIGKAEGADPVPISVAENFAFDARVEPGDEVTFNVQGVLMDTKVASIREVDWGRMQLNFSIVFPEGVLEDAPQFHVFTTKVPDEKASADLQHALVRQFPNVSIIDLRQMLTLVEGILDKISWVINFMAFFSIITGIIVLVGAVRTSKYQRIRESVLLRTIGARGRQILKITALEYLFLGILGSLAGILLSLISSQLLAGLVFETTFVPSYIPFLVLFPAITVLVLLIGLSNSRSVLHRPPLEVLRKEVR
jgi:putative ABC transport system permease protein